MNQQRDNHEERDRVKGGRLPGGHEIFEVKHGGMGVVYLIYHRQLDTPFAVKTFQDRFFADHAAVEQFRQEARRWIGLGAHPHIVEALFVETIDNKPHLFLEYVEGGSLAERLARERIELPCSLDIAIQVCEAMAYAQRNSGLVHRDVKPANVMLTTDGRVKVSDFGLSHAVVDRPDEKKATGKQVAHGSDTNVARGRMGSPLYMSPEQWLADSDVGVRSDIYSFGVVLYEMLCGRRPFEVEEGEPVFVLRAKQLSSPPPLPSTVNEEVTSALEQAVMKCLELAPDDRFADFVEIGTVLRREYESLFGQTWQPPTACPSEERKCSRATELVVKGISLQNLDDHESALMRFDEALTLEPRHALALHMSGRSHAALRSCDEAMRFLSLAEQLQPDDAGLHDTLASCLNESDLFEDALRHAQRSIDLESGSFSPWNNKAIALAGLGRNEESLASFDRAIALQPDSAEVWSNYGFLLVRLGREEEAERCFGRAITLNPRHMKSYFNLNEMLLKQRRVREALALMQQALLACPEHPGAAKIVGILTRQLGDCEPPGTL